MEKISNKIAPVDYEVLYSWKLTKDIYIYIYFFYPGFVSRTFTNYRIAEEGGGHFIISFQSLPPASQTLRD